MAKPLRNASSTQILNPARTFFATTSTSMGRALFQSERNTLLLIDVLRSYVAAGKFQLRDFVVMPDHVHLLLTVTGDTTVERAMQLIKGGFSYRLKKESGNLGGPGSADFPSCGLTIRRAICGIGNTLPRILCRRDWLTYPRNFPIASPIWPSKSSRG